MKALNFEIRPAELADYSQVTRLMEADFAFHHSALPKLFKAGTHVNYDEAKFQALITDNKSAVWVATQVNDIVGLASALLREPPETLVSLAQRYTEIEYVSVLERARRQGIGRALVQTCVTWAVTQETDAIALNVFDFNESAIAFYRSLGFFTLYHRLNLKISN